MAIMYDIKKVFCPNCGLRFTKDEYPGHLDDHYNENFNKKKGKIRKTAGRFQSEDQWITGHFMGKDNINQKKNKKKKKEYVVTYTGEDVRILKFPKLRLGLTNFFRNPVQFAEKNSMSFGRVISMIGSQTML